MAKGSAEVLRTEQGSDGGYQVAVKFVDFIDGDLEALNEFVEKKEEHNQH